ncbi:glutamine amidotransferase [Bosea sp. (in: a-proteobacteria)]|uniref:glutamine amidotransferase n=1 Tax=Bosea sp. (in: a-proteobacteria) TaxID=1871050 RepID=UPI002FC879BC
MNDQSFRFPTRRRLRTRLDRLTPPRKPVLIVLHQEHSTAGRVGRLLAERGYALDIRKPRFGEPLPQTMQEHAGAVIFGGPMSANDPDDFVKAEIDWIGVCLKEKAAFLGICLGAQMLTRHLGGTVYTHPQGRAEIGYYQLAQTEAGRSHAQDAGFAWPGTVYQWHREGFDCPNGAECLATGGDFPVQAIRAGDNAYGIQFHPEVTPAMMCRWSVRGHERTLMPGAQLRQQHLDGWYQYDPAIRSWLDAFLDHWLQQPATSTELIA